MRQRSRQLSPAERPFVRSVLVTGRVWVVATTVQLLTTQLPTRTLMQQDGYLRNWSAVVIDRIPLLSAGVLLGAVAFVSMIRPRLDRLPNGSMVIQSDPLSGLGPNLQRWLSDPTLRIAFAEADSTPTDWLDASGASHRPSAGNGRSTVIVRRDGRPIALIEHDSTVVTADAIRLAAQATASALDAHRQTAVAGSRVIRAQQLGGRLVTAEDDVRTQLAATLEDGPCRQLHDSAASLRTAPDLPIVVDVLQLAAADVRTISHGLFPTELLDGGLSAALPHIAGAPSRRLPRAMELTAFLVVGDERDATMDLTDDSLLIHRRSPLREPYVIDRITALDGMIDGNDVRLPCGAG